MKINCISDSPYAHIITRYFEEQFHKVSTIGKSNLLDVLSDIIIGSKELRYGPIGSPEVVVNIRKVIKDAVEKNLPIPMLVPWGGRKAIAGQLLDVAEVSGLRQLVHIDETIKKFFPKGLQISMRVEDINAQWLYREEADVRHNTNVYSDGMEDLIEIVRGDANLVIFKESAHMSGKEYFEKSTQLSEIIFDYLLFSDQYPGQIAESQQYKALLATGWKGMINTEQRNYYRSRYLSLYPGVTMFKASQMLADYLAGSKARYELNAKGTPISEVTGFIQANFAHQVPGAPPRLFDSTVYYRTVPQSHGRTHIAPWRAKGYLKIEGKGNEATTKVVSWNDPILQELISHKVEIEGKGKKVEIQTDYLVVE